VFSLYFTAPGQVSVREEEMPGLNPGQMLVQTMLSAISPGTEMLIYRGQFPQGLALDESISALAGEFHYPLKYGYAVVGKVIEGAAESDASWLNRLVFAFHPHESHFVAAPEELIPIPDGISPEDAVFLPNMETAVNFVMDGKPLIGERVVVLGQGIVGLLTTSLLAQFPLEALITLDHFPLRRKTSLELGAHHSLDPSNASTQEQLQSYLPGGADLVFELSGSPDALDEAIALAGFGGRVVIGSWYGEKRASLDLGGRFHRNRLHLVSSQVSTLAPELSGRWTKERRFDVAWESLRKVKPSRFITQHFQFQQAAQAYQLIDHNPDQVIQVVLVYK